MSKRFRTFRVVQPKDISALSPETALKLRAENLRAAKEKYDIVRSEQFPHLFYVPRSVVLHNEEEINKVGARVRANR